MRDASGAKVFYEILLTSNEAMRQYVPSLKTATDIRRDASYRQMVAVLPRTATRVGNHPMIKIREQEETDL